MARKDTLGKLKMPGKPMAESEADMDLGMEELGAEELELGDEEGEMMAEEGEELTSAMEDFSDDEIIEEMKLRGLTLDEMEEGEEDYEEEDMEDLGEDEL